MADQSFLGQFFGLVVNTLIGLVSVIYALAIALIPFIASRIVKGDVGATMLTLIATSYSAAQGGTCGSLRSGTVGTTQSMNPGTPSSGPAQTPQSGCTRPLPRIQHRPWDRICRRQRCGSHCQEVQRVKEGTPPMKGSELTPGLPEKLGYTKYYEHDGLLRAYANRVMLLAIIFGLIAMTSLGFAIYVRLQPPTVVRVDPTGETSAINPGSEGQEGLSKDVISRGGNGRRPSPPNWRPGPWHDGFSTAT